MGAVKSEESKVGNTKVISFKLLVVCWCATVAGDSWNGTRETHFFDLGYVNHATHPPNVAPDGRAEPFSTKKHQQIRL